jgi:ankyrin repeat protein
MSRNLELYNAAAQGNLAKIKELISSGGVDINWENPDYQEETPLYAASYLGKLDIVEALLDNGADINSLNAKLMTPLMIAIINHNTPVVKLLLQKGADMYKSNRWGESVFDMASSPEMKKILDNELESKRLIDKYKHGITGPYLGGRRRKTKRIRPLKRRKTKRRRSSKLRK